MSLNVFVFPEAIQYSSSLGGFAFFFEMSIIYIECDGYFVMRVESGITNYTGGLGALLENALRYHPAKTNCYDCQKRCLAASSHHGAMDCPFQVNQKTFRSSMLDDGGVTSTTRT